MFVAEETEQETSPVGVSVYWKNESFECWKVTGFSQGPIIRRIKEFVRKANEDVGNEDSEWRAFDLDPWSIWFIMTRGEEILSVMRIVEKRPNNLIPLEIGVILGDLPKRYAVLDRNVADWNSVAFLRTPRGTYAAFVNFGCVADYCIKRNYSRVFGMYSPFRRGIERVYLAAGAVHSVDYPGPIYFPEFRCNGELVLFKTIEIPKNSLHEIAAFLTLNKAQACQLLHRIMSSH
ncbi:hypothetical protein LEP1GSC047_4218 [Leptospira inadai serovar Lyme str. 10]|uniref:Uncharacterized protein n=2 Tax=Leptospira inadai serovar Lyme TaxID=293084 RepID=V6HWN9_9LEPT|nr:hypothetical protein [Leptospira inadai]EQA37379.1 hypothetical protein LEP1GSC047_4218 [Leptospira inadai serovar Lyme str. 10]PNV73330.1 hypothetical protein BES34_017735 [Leptospira inadai serovar Lyme]